MILLFLPNFHDEVLRLWEKLYSAHVHAPSAANYWNVKGLVEHSYVKMPQIEDMLVNYLSPGETSSWKTPFLPSRPHLSFLARLICRQTSGALHTMFLLQASQTNLLKDLDQGQGCLQMQSWSLQTLPSVPPVTPSTWPVPSAALWHRVVSMS